MEFDDEWWRNEVAQGRHLRSRIDTFLQYWLTMRVREEVLMDETFRKFTDYAKPRMNSVTAAEHLLSELLNDAAKYRSLSELAPGTPAGQFHRRVVQALELAATTPLLMWIVSDNHKLPEDQIELTLSVLESWAIRRTLLRYTTKSVGRTMVSILSILDGVPGEKVGPLVAEYLALQTSDTGRWPSDDELVESIPDMRMYGNVRKGRLSVRGHEKVPTGGQVEVPTGGQIKVPTPCSSCRSGTCGPSGDGEGANHTPHHPGSSIEEGDAPVGTLAGG
ncbi:hypothetical protein [Rhodococcus opacus]|uniref:hypothetical protein n=1 Tax=Rhodococcus opacus TaxID=37919 RepID=UPI0024B89299|nr:hypothetical protein [Rhodococcus opacus]MDJ0412817.1 hypothetical protein [Rhodococcus opacus]